MTAINSATLREALSSFATGVTIVTTKDADGAPVGMTASSFNSVSIDPPLVLWSVTKTAHSAPVFKAADFYSIHVLAAEQMALSNRFAKSGADKFAGLEFDIGFEGVPRLPGVLTRFDCKTWSVYEGGDHWIIVGEVLDMVSKRGEGLVFSGGSYATASSIQPPSASSTADDSGPVEDLLIYNLARSYTQVSHKFHAAVEEAGLTIPEWRILASLHGGKSRALPDLVTRTFVSPKKMNFLLSQMQGKGWLRVEGQDGSAVITGTEEGFQQVGHLFDLASEQETHAMGDAGKSGQKNLKQLLQKVIDNTND